MNKIQIEQLVNTVKVWLENDAVFIWLSSGTFWFAPKSFTLTL